MHRGEHGELGVFFWASVWCKNPVSCVIFVCMNQFPQHILKTYTEKYSFSFDIISENSYYIKWSTDSVHCDFFLLSLTIVTCQIIQHKWDLEKFQGCDINSLLFHTAQHRHFTRLLSQLATLTGRSVVSRSDILIETQNWSGTAKPKQALLRNLLIFFCFCFCYRW